MESYNETYDDDRDACIECGIRTAIIKEYCGECWGDPHCGERHSADDYFFNDVGQNVPHE